MIHMQHYVNGHFELLETCAEIAAYADERDLFVDELQIFNSGGDNWSVKVTLIPMIFSNREYDDIPF